MYCLLKFAMEIETGLPYSIHFNSTAHWHCPPVYASNVSLYTHKQLFDQNIYTDYSTIGCIFPIHLFFKK